uniref:Cytochrome b6-f complex subunit n=1 Tax=Sebdenia flabellata TaxID=42024 RepID=A0A1C9C9N0_9FLOR|nr:cytochrome b6-f complex subunit [Sebdenia flabellata]AOM65096.1 cytochrome b6-f complex subunit [Sebdenia flabellata]
MNILNKYIYIKAINNKINIQIANYLYKKGRIVGEKILFNYKRVPIIELDNYTRIWMLPEELDIATNDQ